MFEKNFQSNNIPEKKKQIFLFVSRLIPKFRYIVTNFFKVVGGKSKTFSAYIVKGMSWLYLKFCIELYCHRIYFTAIAISKILPCKTLNRSKICMETIFESDAII